jgi:hypothetical protein
MNQKPRNPRGPRPRGQGVVGLTHLQSRLSARTQSSFLGLPATKSLPAEVEQILQVFRQPDSGLEVPVALQRLVNIFGPGSEAMSSKLLDDLAVDPSGESRASWDIAIEEAINRLNELKSAQHGEKGNQKGMCLWLFVQNLR